MDRGAWWATVYSVTKEQDTNEVTQHTRTQDQFNFEMTKVTNTEAAVCFKCAQEDSVFVYLQK